MSQQADAPAKKIDSSRPLQEAAKEKATRILQHIKSRPNMPAVRLPAAEPEKK